MPNVTHLLSVAALTTGLSVDSSLEAVRRAQCLLGSHTWSELVRIENSSASSQYPRTVNALIFQLDSVLWFYTPVDGTQSLSLYRGRVEADKLNLAPLLAAIDGGFTRWGVIAPDGEPPSGRGRLPNGCFIESMAIFFQRLANGAQIENPKLLSYYVALPGGIRGHTVFQYTAGGRVLIVDPDRPTRTIKLKFANENDPKSVAGRVRGDIAKARSLPLGEFLDSAPERSYASDPVRSKMSFDHERTAQAEPPKNTRS
jgi:hypothetical protein